MRSLIAAGALAITLSVAACQAPTAPTATPTPTRAAPGEPAPLPTGTPSKATAVPLPTPDAAGLEGGVLVTFDVTGELFRVWVTNRSTIDKVLALEGGGSSASIPNGRIVRGPGQAGHNGPWNWHLDPEEIDMADFTIEVCDGRPSYVEANIEEFVDRVQRYCPWSAKLVDVQDFRS